MLPGSMPFDGAHARRAGGRSPSSGYMISKWISHARCWNVRASMHELADVGERLAGEVVALEVARARARAPTCARPRWHRSSAGTWACSSRCGRRGSRSPTREVIGHLALVEERSAHPLHEPAGRRQRQLVGGESGCAHGAQSVTNRKPSGEKPRGQWKSTNQNRPSSSFVNGPLRSAATESSVSSGVQPGYQSRNWSTGTISATASPSLSVARRMIPMRRRAAL